MGVSSDPHFLNTILLLPMTEIVEKNYAFDTNNILKNGGPYTNLVQLSTTQSKWGRSGYFDNSSDIYLPQYFYQPLSTAPFTIEAWIYFINGNNSYGHPILSNNIEYGQYAQNLRINQNKKLEYFLDPRITGTALTVTGQTTLSEKTWYHVALSVNGTTWKLFVNGVEDASVNNTSYWTNAIDNTWSGPRT